MPYVDRDKFFDRPFSVWVNGPEKSGKTRLALQFPKVFVVSFDPSGLDLILEPENQHLIENLVYHAPMNGKPLADVFQFSETPSDKGIYPAIALAKQMALKGEIKTFLLDGFSYAASLKWAQICESKGVVWTQKEQMDRKESDQRSWYDALGSYLDHLMLQNVFPLTSPPYNLHVVVTCHVQRESDNQVKGIQIARSVTAQEQQASGKRSVNLQSDLSPQVLGSFRQRIGGMPSAHIYLERSLLENGEQDFIAYCRMAFSKSLDTQINAGNRYGLGTLRLTGGNFYKTLRKRVDDARQLSANNSNNAVRSEPASMTTKPTSSTSLTKATSTTK